MKKSSLLHPLLSSIAVGVTLGAITFCSVGRAVEQNDDNPPVQPAASVYSAISAGTTAVEVTTTMGSLTPVFVPVVASATATALPFIPTDKKYCSGLVPKLPSMTMALCQQLGLKDSGARSVKGIPLMRRDVGNSDAKMRVLVIGGIHGDEMSSGTTAMQWLDWAVQNPVNVHWRFIPVLNPDGFLSNPTKRINANGVDLNRNFPTPNWASETKVYWEQLTKKDPRRWPGNQPLSEPESRFLNAEMEAFKPNLIVTIHAPYGVLDFDGPATPPSKLGRLYLDQVGIFPGSLGNYGGVQKGMPVVTIELASSQRIPPESELRQMWLDLQRWMNEKVRPENTGAVNSKGSTNVNVMPVLGGIKKQHRTAPNRMP